MAETFLKFEVLAPDELQRADASVSAYLDGMAEHSSTESTSFKQHNLLHVVQRARDGHPVGLGAESAIESMHHHITNIENRCLHIHNVEDRERSMRQQWLIRQSPESREARAAHAVASARPRRKTA